MRRRGGRWGSGDKSVGLRRALRSGLRQGVKVSEGEREGHKRKG